GAGDDVLEGYSGDDKIVGGAGNDTLTGGSGKDVFVIEGIGELGANGDIITDFSTADDTLDLGGLLAQLGYAGTRPFQDGFLSLRDVTSNGKASTAIDIDVDGPGGSTTKRTVVTLQGVTQADLKSAPGSILPGGPVDGSSTPTNRRPLVTGYARSIGVGGTLASPSLFSAIDPDGDAITEIEITDPDGRGSFFLNGTQKTGKFTVSVADLAKLEYRATSATGSETLSVRARDAGGYGVAADITVTITEKPRQVRFDVNGDGKANLLWRNRDGRIAVSLPTGLTEFMSAGGVANNPGVDWRLIGVADFNGDGKADLLFRHADDSLAVWQLDGATVTDGATLASPGRRWQVAAIGDFNGDGKADVVFQNRAALTGDQVTGQLLVYADGKPPVGTATPVAGPGVGWSIAGVDDFDGNGKQELLWRHIDGRIAVGAPDATALTMVTDQTNANPGITIGRLARILGTGDVNRDGAADILWRDRDGTLYATLMTPATAGRAQLTSSAGLGGTLADGWSVWGTGDVDGDGDLNVIWHQNDPARAGLGNLSLNRWNEASGTVQANPGAGWSLVNRQGLATPPRAVQNSDFDGDGIADILFRNPATGQLAMWRLDGFTIAQGSGAVGVSPGTEWTVQATGDFDGDGKADLFYRNTRTGDVGLWMMDGTQLRRAELVSSLPGEWVPAVTGDFNGDGQSDILWRNTQTAEVGMWDMDDGKLRKAAAFGQIDADWTPLGAADVDGDGKSDILWRNTKTAQLGLWKMDGMTLVQAGLTAMQAPGDWAPAAIGEFDGDGKADMLWRNKTTGQVGIWRMNGFDNGLAQVLDSIPNDWMVEGTGDYDGDGIDDVLWRQQGTDQMAAWFIHNKGGSVGI
ncbi:FG-GAP-like repeat-containing protein, partial [Azospirillum himalayense]